MKTILNPSRDYEAPCIENLEIEVECGFDASVLKYDENLSMPYGDEEEQWF